MLILTRRVGESIVVGDDIVLTVFEVRGDAVRVGIEAPRSVQVHRQEVYDELKRQNEQAVSPDDDAVEALSGALEGTAESQAAPAGSDAGMTRSTEQPAAEDAGGPAPSASSSLPGNAGGSRAAGSRAKRTGTNSTRATSPRVRNSSAGNSRPTPKD